MSGVVLYLLLSSIYICKLPFADKNAHNPLFPKAPIPTSQKKKTRKKVFLSVLLCITYILRGSAAG